MQRESVGPEDACREIASSQRGLIGLNQALVAGLSRPQIRWRLDSEAWRRVLPSVYAISDADDPWLQKLEAARLWTGDAIVTGLSSGALWCFEGIAPGTVEVATATRKRHPEIVVHRDARYDVEDLIRHRGFPVTTPTRTLIDLSGVVGETVLAGALDSALRKGLTFIPLIRTRLDAIGTKGRRGVTALQELLAARELASGLTESPLEIRVERLLRRFALEPPERQYIVTCADGTNVRLDFAWPQQRVGIEADGFRWHSDFEQWQRDARKHNLLQEMDWRIVRVTDRSLRTNPEGLPRQITALLGQTRLALDA